METLRTGDERGDGVVQGLLALRALRASLGESVPPNRIIMGADERMIDDREAAVNVTEMRASFCSAKFERGAVVLRCVEMNVAEQEQHERYFQSTGGWLGGIAREAIAQVDRHAILVLGGGEPMIVDAQDLDATAQRFFIDMDGFAISGRYPTESDLSLGVGWVIQFSGRSPR